MRSACDTSRDSTTASGDVLQDILGQLGTSSPLTLRNPCTTELSRSALQAGRDGEQQPEERPPRSRAQRGRVRRDRPRGPETVQRWLAGTTTPYPRHRATIARALDLTEHQLWPDAAAPPAGSPVPHGHTGVETEATGTWPYAADETTPDSLEFIARTEDTIDLLDNGRGIALTANLIDALAEQATGGRHVRLLTYLPTRRLARLIGRPLTETRVCDAQSAHSLLRVGDAMLLTFNLDGEADRPPPLLMLQRKTAGGLFDRLVENLDGLWDDAEETLTDPVQLDAYATNADEDDDFDQDETVDLEPQEIDAAEPPPRQPGMHPRTADDPAPRRWPRRPSRSSP